MIVGCVECDRLMFCGVDAEFIQEHPVAFDMAISYVSQLSSKRMIFVFDGEQDAPHQQRHHLIQFGDPST